MAGVQAPIYQIEVQGELEPRWSDWFGGLAVTVEDGVTTLLGPVVDQAVLRGILCKIWDLNLVLISVNAVGVADSLTG